ncbi:hypothetical protein DFH28DRAFT_883477 [Melampsora americana]|nr:hypothetical protein DFH28DRAFT_883477 [Melampsora americana]
MSRCFLFRGGQALRAARCVHTPWIPISSSKLTRFPKCGSDSRYNSSSSSSTSGTKVIASLTSGPSSGEPLRMVTDTKSDAKVAFYTMGRILRSVIYTALGLGTSAIVGFVGLHLWVETLELPTGKTGSMSSREDQERYGWDEELEGWGAGYLGGGTDSKLGWQARSLVRAAWVAANWQTGQRAVPGTQFTDGDGWMVDSAFAIAETRLQQALLLARQRGVDLNREGTLNKGIIELESQLASICERINTPLAIQKAHQIYERLWEACASAVDRSGRDGKDSWESREGMRIANKLGDLGLKLSIIDPSLDSMVTETARRAAEQYLIWSVTQGLGLALGDGDLFRQNMDTLDRSTVKSSGGMFEFLMNSKSVQTDGNTNPNSINQPLKAELLLLEASLDALNQSRKTTSPITPTNSSLSPAASRAMISALTRFIVHLVSLDTHLAYNLQRRIQGFLEKAVTDDDLGHSPDAILHKNWLKTRSALASVYLAELGFATKKLEDESIVDLCHSAVQSLDSVLAIDQYSNETFKQGSNRKYSGRLSEQTQQLRHEARTTAVMASNILGIKYETCPNQITKGTPSWCGNRSGLVSAKKFFEKSLEYTHSSSELIKDERLVKLAEEIQQHP